MYYNYTYRYGLARLHKTVNLHHAAAAVVVHVSLGSGLEQLVDCFYMTVV